MHGDDGIISSHIIATAIRQARTPVCWAIDQPIGDDELARLARLGSAFLVDWRMESRGTELLLAKMHHDYPRHLLFLDARSMRADEQRTLFDILTRSEVCGSIVPDLSPVFLQQCCGTGHFVFVALASDLVVAMLPQKISALLGKSQLDHRGRCTVGGAVDLRHARLFPVLDEYARAFPIFISCTSKDWRRYPFLIQAAVTIAPGMRLVALSAPLADESDGWREASATAARQLADVFQGAIANNPALP